MKNTEKSTNKLYKQIGEIVSNLRMVTGVSQQELANVLSLHQTALCRVENGSQRLNPAQIQNLALFFNIPIDALFSGLINYSNIQKKFHNTLTLPEAYSTHPFSKLRESYPLLDFLTQQLGPLKLKEVLSHLNFPPELLICPDTVLGPEFQLDLAKIAISEGLLTAKSFPKLIAQTRTEKLHGPMFPIYETLLSPLPLLQTLIFNMHRYETNFKYDIEDLNEKKLILSIKPEAHMHEVPYKEEILGDFLCRYKKGYFTNFPNFISRSPLTIVEKECHFKNKQRCVYAIQAS